MTSASAALSRATKIQIGLLIFIGVIFRILWLDHIPGLNGDDAWLPVQIRNFMVGGKFTFMTVSERPIAPTYLLVQYLLQVFPFTHILLVRLPTLLGSLGTLVAIYFMFRKAISERALWLFLLGTAILPPQIAYARSMGEMSQVMLAGAVTLGFMFQGRMVATLIAFVVALSVHPTSIFLLPLLVGCIGYDLFRSKKWNWKYIAFPAILGVVLIVWQIVALPFDLSKPMMAVSKNLPFIDLLPWHAFYYSMFMVGIPVFEDFVGPLQPPVEFYLKILSVAVLILTVFTGGLVIFFKRQFKLLVYTMGFTCALVGLFLLVGVSGFTVGYERFGLFLVVPGTLLFAWIADEVMEMHKSLRPIGLIFVLLLSAGILGSFYYNYFYRTQQTGGQAHNTYRTGTVEPKLQAFQWIESDSKKRAPGTSKTVVVEDWWLLWPIKYFNGDKKEFRVLIFDPGSLELTETQKFEDLKPLIKEGGVVRIMVMKGNYLVGFAGEPLDRLLSTITFAKMIRHNIYDYSGRTVLTVWRKQD